MRFSSFLVGDEVRVGVLQENDWVWDLRAVWFHYLLGSRQNAVDGARLYLEIPSDMGQFMERWNGQVTQLRSALTAVSDEYSKEQALAAKLMYPVSQVKILAPILRPSKIVCMGNAFRAHIIASAAVKGIAEKDVEVPAIPKISFFKTASAIIGPGDLIRYPKDSKQWDYEGELAIVIGKFCSQVAPHDVKAHVFGYTIMHDACVRDIPNVLGGIVSPRAKSCDTMAPMGPAVATPDELGDDPREIRIRTWVNGDLRQDANTADFLWPIEEMVSLTSRYMSLLPGDVIATSSPPGVGLETGRYIHEGDVVRIEVTGIGVLENRVGQPR